MLLLTSVAAHEGMAMRWFWLIMVLVISCFSGYYFYADYLRDHREAPLDQ